MLDTLRRHSQSYIIYLFFGVIIVVFVFFFGPQSDGCAPSQATEVASVEGRQVLSIQVEQLMARVGQFERGLPESEQVPPGARRRQLAEDIVLVRLLAAEARVAGMQVSDDQFGEYIRDPQRNPDFSIYSDREGSFDFERYELTVPGTFGMSLPEYEAWKEDEVLARRFMTLLTEAVVVTPDEVQGLHRLRNTQYNLEYVQLQPEALAELFTISDARVDALIANERERVEAYYAEHSADFEAPRTLRVRRVFIRLPGESDPEGREEALANYEEALQLVTDDPETFADVAATYSQSTDAESGGDMGLKPVDDYLSYPFMEDQLEELEVGEVATYESQVSRIIFRIEEDNAATLPPFEDVSVEVARALLESERDESQLEELAQWFLEQANAGLTLEEAALEHARLHAAEETATIPDETEVDEASETGEGDEAEASDETETAESDDDGSDDDDEPELEPLVEVQQTGLFAIDDPGMDLSQFGPQFAGQRSAPREPTRIPRLGDSPELARAVPRLTSENPVAPEVYEVEGSYIVARLAERIGADEEIDDDTYQQLRDDIWRQKVGQLFGSWEARIIFHRPLPLGALLQERLIEAINDGEAHFNDAYFVEPEIEPAI